MGETADAALTRIRGLAEEALQQTGTPQPVTQALEEIVALAQPGRGDTPEASDPLQTENQTL